MKNSTGNIIKRRQQIIDYMREHKEAYIETLSETLHTSPATLRRDFTHFEKRGLITRFHGGARLIDDRIQEERSSEEFLPNTVVKKLAIAKLAATYVEDGDTIFMNSSSTVLSMLHYLKDISLTIITNNANIVTMDIPPRIDIILVGGELHHKKKSIVGDYAVKTLQKIRADKAFLGAGGVTTDGITTAALQETAINDEMLKRCTGDTFLLVAPHKIGRTHNFKSSGIHRISHIITTNGADTQEVEKLRQTGITIIETT